MHEHLRQFFDEHKQPTHCSTRDVHDLALPILTLATRIQQQVVMYRQKLLQAKLVDHDGELDPKMERLRQKLKSLEGCASEFIELGERMAEGFKMWDQIMAEDQALIDQWSARKSATVGETPGPAIEAGVK
jgi:hypothetical protein